MNKSGNLIPFDERTESEQRAICKMGGIASGKARREKKRMREAVETILKADVPDKLIQKMKENGIDGNDYYTAVGFALVCKALKGDVSAFRTICELIGEKPTNNINISGEALNNPFEGLTTKELRKIVEEA